LGLDASSIAVQARGVNVEQAWGWLSAHRQQYVEDLKTLVRIPSVSLAGFAPATVRHSAEATAELLRSRGARRVRVLEIEGAHPCVVGELFGDPRWPTVLLYAHHDVQPAGDDAEWSHPPFDPVESGARLYGRGAADDKSAIVAFAAAIEACLSTLGELPLNLRLLIEGEEECGSTHLGEYLQQNPELLEVDAVLLADTDNFEAGLPSLTTSLRGLVACDITVRGLAQSLHSGGWGGPVPDPSMGLCRALASLVKPDGTLNLPSVTHHVRPLTTLEQEAIESLPSSSAHFRKSAGLLEGVELLSDRPWESTWRKPALVVHALQASSRKDARNILCHEAWAQVGVRLVPDMNPDDLLRELEAALRSNLPWGLELSLSNERLSSWWCVDTENQAFVAALRALEGGYGRPAIMIGCGASIPFVDTFSRLRAGVPIILLGIEDPLSNAHSENESLSLDDWEKCARSIILFFHEYGTSSGFLPS
jgi:acetylornithine deacetylase/succinyl-diaminopimelate desuccinylase-like protein